MKLFRHHLKCWFAVSICALLFAPVALAAVGHEQPVDIRLILPSTEFAAGKSYPILMEIKIKDEYHINSKKPLNPVLVPTTADFAVSDNRVAMGRIVFPKPELKKFSFSPEKLSVHEGTVYLVTSVSLSEGVEGSIMLTANLNYQACTDEVCLLPNEISAQAELKIGTGGKPLETALFDKHAASLIKTAGGEDIFSSLQGSLGLTAFLLIFLGGLALNLTPCVYPMIPVTIGYFGGVAGRSRAEIVLHSLVYLLGMAAMYSALGVVAALTGSLFGEMMQNTFAVLFLVGVMLALSLSMFGVWEIRIPSRLAAITTKNYGGLFGTFFMGITVGIIAAPCVGPFVIGLLTYVGERQDPLLGFAMFFVLALGLGLPLVVLAISSGGINRLPRSGVWMIWVRKFFGIVLIGMALYFAQPLIPDETWFHLAVLALAFAGGIYLISAGKDIGGKVFNFFRYGIGFGMMAMGLIIFSLAGSKAEGLAFKEYSQAAFDSAVANKKPVVIDFTADWCLPCQELKVFTFTNRKVLRRAGEFEALEVDLTRIDDHKIAIKKKFRVLGVPTLIFFDSEGKEVYRATGFINAKIFLEKLDALKPPTLQVEPTSAEP